MAPSTSSCALSASNPTSTTATKYSPTEVRKLLASICSTCRFFSQTASPRDPSKGNSTRQSRKMATPTTTTSLSLYSIIRLNVALSWASSASAIRRKDQGETWKEMKVGSWEAGKAQLKERVSILVHCSWRRAESIQAVTSRKRADGSINKLLPVSTSIQQLQAMSCCWSTFTPFIDIFHSPVPVTAKDQTTQCCGGWPKNIWASFMPQQMLIDFREEGWGREERWDWGREERWGWGREERWDWVRASSILRPEEWA